MMKKRFLNIYLLALLIVFLLTSGSVKAMENDQDILDQQKKEFAKNMFVDSVEKNDKFRNLLESYIKLPISENSKFMAYNLLQKEMKNIYDKYIETCKLEIIPPFIPGGILSFLSEEIQEPQAILTFTQEIAFTQEIEKLSFQMEKNFLFPEISPLEIWKVINQILYPKYSPLVNSKFKRSPMNQDRSELENLKFFLSDKNIDLINDQNLMVILLRMFNPFPVKNFISCCSGLLDQSSFNILKFPFGRKTMIAPCSGIKKHKFYVNIKRDSYPSLEESIQGLYLHNGGSLESQINLKQQILEKVTKELNKIFFVCGKQCYDISQNGSLLGRHLQDWLNMMRELVKFERQEWKVLGRNLGKLSMEYNWAHKKLTSQTDVLYSGVSLGDYSIALNTTRKRENAEERSNLINDINAHYITYEEQMGRYEQVKPYLPTLKKMQKWLEDIYEFMAKKGRMS